MNCQIIDCLIDTSKCYVSRTLDSGKIELEVYSRSVDSFDVRRTPLLVDINGDCVPEILSTFSRRGLYFIDTQTGETVHKINTPLFDPRPTNFAVADIDSDGEIEIVLAVEQSINIHRDTSGRLICYELDGRIKWMSDERYIRHTEHGRVEGNLGLADFNQDGIAEVYILNRIYNAETGVLLIDGGLNGIGRSYFTSVTIAAQLDSNEDDLELAAGYTIYNVDIQNTTGTTGNSMTPSNVNIAGAFKDGLTAVADVNMDGVLDVIVHSDDDTRRPILYAYSLIGGSTTLLGTINLPPNSFNYALGIEPTSTPVIGHLGRSMYPSIIAARDTQLLSYIFDGVTLRKEWQFSTTDSSGSSTCVLFDIDGDGNNEIIYRDMRRLQIMEAELGSPSIIASSDCRAPTLYDSPIIADCTGDGEANIVIGCGSCIPSTCRFGSFLIFGSAPGSKPWSPAPTIWNQYAYHTFGVNDNLTIPIREKNRATEEGGRNNHFMGQSTLLDTNGFYKVRAASLYGLIDCINYDFSSEEYIVEFSLFNNSDASLTALWGMPIGFYSGDPRAGGQLLGVYLTSQDIPPGDSLINLTFTLRPPIVSPIFMVVNSDRNTFINIDETEFQQLECDYFDNFSQIIDLPEIVDVTGTVCSGEDFVFLDTVILHEGEYIRKLQSRNGCDSICARLSLTTKDSAFVLVKEEACDSLSWRGQTHYSSGIYKDRISVPDGCDSIYALDLTIYHSFRDTQRIVACDKYVFNSDTIYDSGPYTFVGQSKNGCDSSFTIELQINNSSSSIISYRTCKSYTWKGNVYTSSGAFTFDTLNADGCDSSVTLNLTIEDSIFVNETINICDGDTIIIFGEEVATSRSLQRAFTSADGCDSLHTVNVLVDGVYRGQRDVSFCEGDSVFVIDRWFSTEGSHDIVKLNPSDCDSIITVVLTELEIVQSFDTISLCKGDTIQVFDTLISSGSNVARAFMSSKGCDSISNVNIIEIPSPVTIDTFRLCEGDTLDVFGQVITSTSDLSETYVAHNGCDSTSIVHVSFINSYSEDQSVQVCPDDSVFLNGHWFFSDTTISISLQTVQGCDSIVNHDINFLRTPEPPTFEIDCELGLISASISPGSEWNILWDNGDTTGTTFYQSGGRKEVSLSSQSGCFVSYTEVVEVVPDLSVLGLPGDTILSPGSLLRLQLGLDNSQWQVLWLPVDIIDCDTCFNVNINTTTTTEITIILSHVSGCDLEHRFIIQFDESIYVPNVFTPNGDNLNDVFTAYFTDNISILSCEIYDRWGELVFSSINDNGFGWDGTFNGENAPSAVYTYKLEYENTNNERKVVAGDITLLR